MSGIALMADVTFMLMRYLSRGTAPSSTGDQQQTPWGRLGDGQARCLELPCSAWEWDGCPRPGGCACITGAVLVGPCTRIAAK